MLCEVGDSVSSGTRMGTLKIVAINSEQGKFILNRINGHNYLLSVKPETDMTLVLNEVMKE
jgi:hypothetical protein